MDNVINLIERYGRARFSRRIEQEEDEYAETEFYNWLDQQRCSFCGGDPDLLSWFEPDQHYCLDCARKAGILNSKIWMTDARNIKRLRK